MKLKNLEYHISQGMLVADDRREPMVIRIQYLLKDGIDPKFFKAKNLKAATLKVLQANPTLLKQFSMDRKKISSTFSLDFEKAAETAWDMNALTIDDFRQRGVPFDSAPLFRFKIDPRNGLNVTVHHALLDGRGALTLTTLLGEAIFNEAATISDLSVAREGFTIPKLNFGARMKLIWASLRGIFSVKKKKPVLMGEKTQLFGNQHYFLTEAISNEDAFGKLERIKKIHNNVNFYDLAITAYHLTAQDNLQKQIENGEIKGGKSTISSMMPVDLRPSLRRAPILANLSSSMSIDSSIEERKNPVDLLLSLKEKSKIEKNKKAGLVHATGLWLLDKIGFMKKARRIMIQTGEPRRAHSGGDSFWKYINTGMITSVGKVRLPAALKEVVTEVRGYPPTLPPMGPNISFGHGPVTTFNMHFSNATMTKSEGRQFLKEMVGWIERIVQIAETKPA